MDNCTTNIENNKYFSDEIKKDLDLEKSPVAIKFIVNEKDVPENIAKLDGKIRHCEMVQTAAQGEKFYATREEQLCNGGSAALGLEKFPDKIKSGEFYYNLGRFKSIGSAKRTIDAIPKMDLNSYGIIYSPLEDADFEADIILIIAKPVQAMKVSQAIIYTLGGRIDSNYAGIQSICADAVAGPFNTKTPNMTLGCYGSRQYADIKEEELIIGLNGENIGCTVNALNAIS